MGGGGGLLNGFIFRTLSAIVSVPGLAACRHTDKLQALVYRVTSFPALQPGFLKDWGGGGGGGGMIKKKKLVMTFWSVVLFVHLPVNFTTTTK